MVLRHVANTFQMQQSYSSYRQNANVTLNSKGVFRRWMKISREGVTGISSTFTQQWPKTTFCQLKGKVLFSCWCGKSHYKHLRDTSSQFQIAHNNVKYLHNITVTWFQEKRKGLCSVHMTECLLHKPAALMDISVSIRWPCSLSSRPSAVESLYLLP